MIYYRKIRIDHEVFLFDEIVILFSEDGFLLRMLWPDESDKFIKYCSAEKSNGENELIRQITGYFEGNVLAPKVRTFLDNPDRYAIDIYPTEWQLKVWNQARDIPYGETITYGELARRCDNPKGARAVGAALGRNPIPIIVPCHRIVAQNGLGGFSAPNGIALKSKLLKFESSNLK